MAFVLTVIVSVVSVSIVVSDSYLAVIVAEPAFKILTVAVAPSAVIRNTESSLVLHFQTPFPVPAFVTLLVSVKSASPYVLACVGTPEMFTLASAFAVSVITTLTVESA